MREVPCPPELQGRTWDPGLAGEGNSWDFSWNCEEKALLSGVSKLVECNPRAVHDYLAIKVEKFYENEAEHGGREIKYEERHIFGEII